MYNKFSICVDMCCRLVSAYKSCGKPVSVYRVTNFGIYGYCNDCYSLFPKPYFTSLESAREELIRSKL